MKKFTKYIVMTVVTGAFFIGSLWYGRQYKEQQDKMQLELAQKVLRFHVLANSDSAEDQFLKQKVRDAVGSYMQEYMDEMESKEACENFIVKEKAAIEACARQVIEQEGYQYEVEAELVNCYFPVKTYGNYTFPEGEYDALRVVIGEGAGQNWWCVMYPNMCFVNSLYEVTDERSGKALRAVLDEEEYEAVLNSGKYTIKWKLFEIW